MNILLDTHAFLWWITDDPQLSAGARDVLRDGTNVVFVSAASGWEIAIKAQLGKLPLSEPPEQFVPAQLGLNSFRDLPIQMRHALHVYTLPLHHRDPFDRVLVAQSQLEQLPIVTADPLIAQYDVQVIW
ncbi:MAG TPA: type II toxin-antitoxin system VapC family toxin [Roseiflexaceae bacterium]|jgi:PIN domain nuclease of toxin-antitoxin system|nr:type II toxin-antitoxin system VapC family toxin [Roseiflexaceae bacterium]